MQIPEKRARLADAIDRQIKRKGLSAQPAKNQEAAAKGVVGATVSNSEIKTIRSIITSPSSQDKKAEEIFACINRLEERIDLLEAQMKRHFGNSKLVESEIGRLVSDKWESLSKETDECLTRMMGEMQDLRDIVIGLRSSVRGMEK